MPKRSILLVVPLAVAAVPYSAILLLNILVTNDSLLFSFLFFFVRKEGGVARTVLNEIEHYQTAILVTIRVVCRFCK